MSPSSKKSIVVSQEIPENNNESATTKSNSRLYQLGVLCASPGLTKNNLTNEMLSNIDKSKAIKNDQRKIISTIHKVEENATSGSIEDTVSKVTEPIEKLSQSISFELSNSSSNHSSNVSSTTSSKFDSSRSTSLKRKRIPPPLNLSANKKSNNEIVTSTTTRKRFNSNHRLKYLSSSGNSSSNIAKSAPPNILHFPGRTSKSLLQQQQQYQDEERNNNSIDSYYKRKTSQDYFNGGVSMYQYNPYYPYPPTIPMHMMMGSPGSELTPHFYSPYGYPAGPPPPPPPPAGYMIPYPYMYHTPPYSNPTTAVDVEEPLKEDGEISNKPDEKEAEPNDNKEQQPDNMITGDIRIMNNIFTFEFPHDETLDKHMFLSICNKVWNENLELSRK